jgi:uncharacterized protein (TIGR03067 family)
MMHTKALFVFSSCIIFLASLLSRAQDVSGRGSTAQGDILRGEGVYLRGKGIYDLYSAKGRRIDAGTEIMIQKWNQQVYAAYMRERAAHIQSKKNRTTAAQAATLQKMAEREERLRTSPTDDDIVSGDALNALLVDLSNPMISYSSWRAAPVALPAGISIRSLFFRFAPRLGDRNSSRLTNNLIALGRLDQSRGWPIFIPEDKVGPECRAYERTHRELLDECEKKTLKLEVVTNLDAALAALKAKVSTTVPTERNFRTAAMKYIADMQAATNIFDASTIDFAQEMIVDTHEYQPQTVGELLAFLRKYRLFFASAEGRPDDGDLYRALFGSMQKQKESLGLPTLSPQQEAEKLARTETAKLEGTWVLLRTRKDDEVKKAAKEPAKRVFLTFQGNRYAIKNAQGVRQSGTWTLDITKTPKVLDRAGMNFQNQRVTLLGIYDWINDNLRICTSPTQRPNEFNASPGSGRTIQFWARVGP